MKAFLTLLALIVASPALAAVPDCPLANASYSVDSPLIDLLLNDRVRAALDEAGELKGLSPFVTGTTAPSFGAIVSMRQNATRTGAAPARLEALDRRLRAIRITAADRAARCARYDTARPKLAPISRRPAILVFDRVAGFVHTDALKAAREALVTMGERRGWTIVFTDRPGAFDPAILRRFDAVVWNNVSGDVLTLRQRAALRGYVERGGGFAAFHGSSGDPLVLWDWYADTLVGARFIGHPMEPQFQAARLVVDDARSPVAAGLPASWTMTDEWYSFSRSARRNGAHVLVSIDEQSYAPKELAMGDHPMAWTRCVGSGRSFYSAIGHLPANYSEGPAARLLEQGIAWAAGQSATTCRQGREIARKAKR